MSRAWAWWSELWFGEVDARSLAVMRVTLGVLLISWHLSLWPQLETLFAPWGAIDAKMIEDSWTIWGISYLAWVREPWQLHLVHALGLGVLVAWTLGWRTRIMGFLAVFLMVSAWHRNSWIHNGGDRLLRISLIYMVLTPCGAMWSLDALRTGARATVPALTHRLLQLQWMVMYTYTGFAKLPGNTWQEGSALYYSLSDAGYARAPALMDSLLANDAFQVLTRVATWTSITWEVLFIPFVLWPKTRYVALGLGVVFHLGVFFGMDVGFFSLVSIWGYLAWLKPAWLGDRVQTLFSRPAAAA